MRLAWEAPPSFDIYAVFLTYALLVGHIDCRPRGFHSEAPDIEWERPTCDKCDWVGEPVPIFATADSYEAEEDRPPPEGECVIPTVPLRKLLKPGDPLEK